MLKLTRLFSLISIFACLNLASSVPVLAQSAFVTFEDIKRVSPTAKDELVQALIDLQPELAAAQINTDLRMAHFLTQVMTETGGVARLDENMNYSFDTLMRVFSRKVVSEAKAREIARKPREVANWVYGGRDELGNLGRHTNDGWDYRGSGYLQLTGRYNFRERGAAIGFPLEEKPDMAREPRAGLLAAIAYWQARNINDAADDNDIRRVRILVNGPKAHGLPQAIVWFDKTWKRIYATRPNSGIEASAVVDAEGLFDQMMENSGLLDSGTEAGNIDTDRSDALRRFQTELGLAVTGTLDEATQLALLDPREWRYLDIESVAAPADTQNGLEQTTTFVVANMAKTETDIIALPPFESTAEPTGAQLDRNELARLAAATGNYAPYETGPTRRGGFVPHSVIEPDTRVAVLSTTQFPARAIVQILFRGDDGFDHLCSGSMISADLVLTAGHCVHSGTNGGELYTNFRVVPGRNVRMAPFGTCGVRKAYVLNGWIQSDTDLEGRYYDMGALRLDCSVGDVTGWLGLRALDDIELGIETTVQGYAADVPPFGRQWTSTDQARLIWSLKGFYENDTYGGTSGSPVFAGDDLSTLVGIHTNGLHGTEKPWSELNAFTKITPDRLRTISDWIAN